MGRVAKHLLDIKLPAVHSVSVVQVLAPASLVSPSEQILQEVEPI